MERLHYICIIAVFFALARKLGREAAGAGSDRGFSAASRHDSAEIR